MSEFWIGLMFIYVIGTFVAGCFTAVQWWMAHPDSDIQLLWLPNHIVAAGAVVLNEQGEVLLIKDDRRNSWTFPGGIVEEGEGLLDGVKREVLEETGIEIEVGELFCVTSNTCKHPGYNGIREVPPKVMLDFVCRAIGGTPRPSEENSHHALPRRA